MASRFDTDFWQNNAWKISNQPVDSGVIIAKTPDDLGGLISGGENWLTYGHVGGVNNWLKQGDEGLGGIQFSYKEGVNGTSITEEAWPGSRGQTGRVITGFSDWLEENEIGEGSGALPEGATVEKIRAAVNDGSMGKVLDQWANTRAQAPWNDTILDHDPTASISFLTDTPRWEAAQISRDARLAAALYHRYARDSELALLWSLAPTKSSIEREVANGSALSKDPSGFSDEEKIWIYQYVFGPINYTSGQALSIPDYIEWEDVDIYNGIGLHAGKLRASQRILEAVTERYTEETNSEKSKLRDQARQDLVSDPSNYEERVFNDQCWLLTNMQSVHIKSTRGASGKDLIKTSKGGPGPGSIAPGQLAIDQNGNLTSDPPGTTGQANIPKWWSAGGTPPTPNSDGSTLYELGWPYRNFTVLRGNPYDVSNTLLAKENVRPFLDITPAEASLLVPKIRFFKVFLGGSRGQNKLPEAIKEVEFPFRTHSDISMLSRQKPGSGVGIESVSYTLQGSNFATAKKLVDVKARFYFRSMKDFTEKIPVNVTVGSTTHNLDLSFMDLVAYARGLGPDPAKELKAGDKSNFLLKVVLGWSVPMGSGPDKVIKDPTRRKQIQKALESSTLVLFINATGFTYSFNDDGSMTADVTYGGYLENALDSLNLDIFGLKTAESTYWDGENRFWEAAVKYFETVIAEKEGKTVEGPKQTTSDGPIEKDILSRTAHDYDVSRKRLLNTVEIISSDAKVKDVSWTELLTPGDASYQRELEINKASLEASLAEAKLKREASLQEGRGVRWRRLLTKIMNKKETDIFTALISSLTPYQKKLAAGRALSSGERGEFAESRDPSDDSEFVIVTEDQETFRKTNGQTQREKATKQVLNAVALQNTGRRDLRQNPSLLLYGDPYFRTGTSGGRDKGVYRIHFIYLGDIIEAAMEVLKEVEQKDEIYPKAKLLTGDFKPHRNIYGGGLVNLADIPISMDNFLNFFVEQVVEKERDTYPLMTFITDIIEKLVKPLIANSCDSDTATQLDINTTYLMLKGKGENGEINPIPNGRVSSARRLKALIGKGGNKTPGWKKMNGYFHYIYIYADTPLATSFKENRKDDESRKVYHLALGRDRGLVKNAVFKKRDVRGLEEARAFSERGASVTDNILIPYHDVDIKLMGNTIFWPGMLFYLDPAFAGLGTKSTRRRISQELNIGGYYRVIKVDGTISRDGFESQIDGTYVFNPLQRNDDPFKFVNLTDEELEDVQ